MKKILLFVVAGLALSQTSCKKEYDSPPIKEIPVGNVITVDSLRSMFQGTSIKFTQDYSVYGIITADETSGNLYKTIYMQDGTGAINLRLLTSGGVYQGDSVRLYLKGCVLSKYNGMIQIDSVNTDNNIIKQATGKVVVPQTVTISQINSTLQSRLIKIDDVEFSVTDAGTTYADAVNQQSANKTIEDCNGNTIIIRNSGYANFAGSLTATGKGSLIAVVGEYNGVMQLYIRNVNDVNMPGPRCTGSVLPILYKDFEDASATSGGWTLQNVTGSVNWVSNSMGANFGSYYGQCSNYSGGSNSACESWLISPAVDLSATTNPEFMFENACNYSGPALEVYISTNYASGSPGAATWTALTPALSTGGWAWINSGAINLSAYKTTNVRVAFKYTGTSTSGKTWEIDNVVIQDN
jgi:hypothetical protein